MTAEPRKNTGRKLLGLSPEDKLRRQDRSPRRPYTPCTVLLSECPRYVRKPVSVDITPADVAELKARPIVVASHQRSGTHLSIDLMRRQFDVCRSWKYPGERLEKLAPSLDRVLRLRTRRAMRGFLQGLKRTPRPIIKTHCKIPELIGEREPDGGWSTPRLIDWLRENAVFCYAARDGREVMASYHLYTQQLDSSAAVPFSQFLRATTHGGLSRCEHWRDHVDGGLDHPSVLTLRFHKTIHETRRTIEEMAGAFGVEPNFREPLIAPPVASGATRRFSRLFRLKPESTAHPGRSGRPKKWPLVFGESDREYFARCAGDMLIRLGVEESSAWAESKQLDRAI